VTPVRAALNLIVVGVLFASLAWAEVKLPAILQDGMVLQRDIPIHLWGMAAPNESVTAEFRGEKKSITADDLGRWSLYLSPGTTGGPFELTITASNTIRMRDVLVGDVWIASGQSNMEWPTIQLADHGAKELAQADFPNVRLFKVDRAFSEYPLLDVRSQGWRRCSAQTAAHISAIGFLFARELHQRYHIPIGIIDSTWGGTSIESWTSLEAIGSDPTMMPMVAARGRRMEQQAERELQQQQHDAAIAAGKKVPDLPWRPDPPMWSLSQLYNAMIAPLTPLAIRGAIWYQGEQNTRRDAAPEVYGRQLMLMISSWRAKWGIGDFPFYFVQLANFRSGETEDWATVRDGQRQALQLANTGMAVTIDIGDPDDVHPLNKQDVAARLARVARSQLFGEKIEYSGPLFRQATRDSSALRLWFDHIGSGLEARGGALTGFELAGSDGKFRAAEARIEGNSVIVGNAEVPQPVAVRYAWANDPRCNLFNKDGLPASPFLATVKP